jgi:hypothetical protein
VEKKGKEAVKKMRGRADRKTNNDIAFYLCTCMDCIEN